MSKKGRWIPMREAIDLVAERTGLPVKEAAEELLAHLRDGSIKGRSIGKMDYNRPSYPIEMFEIEMPVRKKRREP